MAALCRYLQIRHQSGTTTGVAARELTIIIIIIITYIYHTLINALSAHMIHINLNMIFYTLVEHPAKTIYIKYYIKKYIYI